MPDLPDLPGLRRTALVLALLPALALAACGGDDEVGPKPDLPTETPAIFAWQGRASSNSGAYTILASFVSEDAARIFEHELDDMYQAHLDFMVEDSERAMDHYRVPTPPMVALAERYGFTWPAENGFAWEGDSFGDREEAAQTCCFSRCTPITAVCNNSSNT